MKNKLYIMIGIPGSGKSTFAKEKIKQTSKVKYVSRDEIRFNLLDSKDDYFAKEDKVFKTFISNIQHEINNGFDVIADATHLNKASRHKLLMNLNLDSKRTEIIAVFMRTPLEECLRRNETRKGTKTYVPKDVIIKMNKSLKSPSDYEYGGLIKTIIEVTPNKIEIIHR